MQTEDSHLHLVERFFSGTGATYDAMVDYATFGIDRRWKRHIVAQVPVGARRILDLASGTGILTRALAQRFPSAEVVGVELREEYLAVAHHNHFTMYRFISAAPRTFLVASRSIVSSRPTSRSTPNCHVWPPLRPRG
jgi:ubiquinone/menaquinone biosynthesis C-methylase UbiE